MQIIINLPKDVYENIIAHDRENREGAKSAYYFEGLIQNGTPLPDEHGDFKWITVSERLPKEGGKYICWFKEQKRDIVTMVAWQPKLRSWNLTGNMAYWKVFAWMPLPRPYKAEREE